MIVRATVTIKDEYNEIQINIDQENDKNVMQIYNHRGDNIKINKEDLKVILALMERGKDEGR